MKFYPSQKAVYDAKVAEEASHILNFLASMPSGISSTTRPVVAKIMLDTSGRMMACGALYDIKAKPLGAGIYRVTLRPVYP